MAYSQDERLQIVKKICERYVAGISIEKACENVEREGGRGISAVTFYQWLKETNELNELYKKAKLEFTVAENERYLQRARGSLWTKLDYHKGKEHIRQVTIPDPEDPSKPIIKQVIKDSEVNPPDSMLIIATLNNLDPDFKDPTKHITDNATDAHLDAALDVTNLYKDE